MSWQLTCKACGLPFRLSQATQKDRAKGASNLITVECPLCHAIYDYGALDLQQTEYNLGRGDSIAPGAS
jgi:hypothetical protein